jgi:hypothetical protein
MEKQILTFALDREMGSVIRYIEDASGQPPVSSGGHWGMRHLRS